MTRTDIIGTFELLYSDYESYELGFWTDGDKERVLKFKYEDEWKDNEEEQLGEQWVYELEGKTMVEIFNLAYEIELL